MKNVPIKDRKSIKERGKNLFKKDLTGSVMNANESADASGNSDIKAQQKKQDMIKKRVLMAKLRAVRSGGGDSITASYNPELSVISEVDGDTKKEKVDKIINIMKGKNKIEVNPQVKAEEYTVTNADKKGNTPAWKGYKSGKKNVKTGKPLYKAADHVKEHHTKDKDGKVIEHEDTTPSSVEEGLVDAVKKGAKRHAKAIEKKKIKNRKAVPYAALGASYQPEDEMVEDYHSGTGEKVQKRTLAWMKKKGQKGAPGLDAMKARTAEHKAKRGVKEEIVNELKTSTLRSYVNRASVEAVGRGVDAGVKGMTGPKKEMEKNMTKAYKRMRGINTAANKLASRAERKKEVKEDKAFNYVLDKLRKKHGKDAVITKTSKQKPPTEEQKKKAAAERKKRQDADNKAYAARAKKAGFKSTQDYTNVVARYGSEDNYNKGKGLGT